MEAEDGESANRGVFQRARLSCAAITCSAELAQHHLPHLVSVLQGLDQPGQGDVVVGVGQLGGGQRWEVEHQVVDGRGDVC